MYQAGLLFFWMLETSKLELHTPTLCYLVAFLIMLWWQAPKKVHNAFWNPRFTYSSKVEHSWILHESRSNFGTKLKNYRLTEVASHWSKLHRLKISNMPQKFLFEKNIYILHHFPIFMFNIKSLDLERKVKNNFTCWAVVFILIKFLSLTVKKTWTTTF